VFPLTSNGARTATSHYPRDFNPKTHHPGSSCGSLVRGWSLLWYCWSCS